MNGFPQYLERLGRWVPSPMAGAPAPPDLHRTPVAHPAAGRAVSTVDTATRGLRPEEAVPESQDRSPRA